MSELKFDPKVLHKEFKTLFKAIKDNQVIVVYRHQLPDYDAFGSQMGLVTWIKDNFKNKEVHFVGEGHTTFVPSLFPEPEVLDEAWYKAHDKQFLALVCDTANTDRISENNTTYAKQVIKIDHHPNVDSFGDVNIVYPMFGAASELLALFCQVQSRRYIVSKECARYFFIGIVGDTGRFQYPDTSGMTLRITASLMDIGLDITEIYSNMYAESWRTMEFLKYVLNNYVLTKKGVCYYVLSDKVQKELGITLNEGKLHINTFRNVQGVDICVSITEDVEHDKWKVSLRSVHTKINQVASNFKGGGHDFAAGCEIKTLDELPSLIKQLEDAIGEK